MNTRNDKTLQPAYGDRGALRPRRPDNASAPAQPAGPVPPPPHDEESLELRRLILALLGRKWEVLVVAALVVIPVAIATAFAERLYRSTALIQIDPEPVQVLPYREFDLPRIAQNYDMLMKSQEQILRGPTLTLRIAERLRTRSDAPDLQAEVPRLWKRLSIQRLETTQMFRLMYVAGNPKTAAAVANVFAEEYIKLQFEVRQETRRKARDLLRRELDGLEQKVQLLEKDLVAYAQQNRIGSPETGQNLVEQKLKLLGTQLADAEAEVFVARSRAATLEKASVAEFPERLMSQVISDMTTTVAGLEHELTALRANFGENWPAVKQKRSEIAVVRDQLELAKASALAQAREQAQMDLAAAEGKRQMLASSMAEQQDLANKLQNATIQYNIIRREVETSQKMYEGLLERLKQTSVTTGMEFGGFRVVEPARPSTEVDSPKVLWNLALACILGLALGICVALGRDFWDTSIGTVEEVEQLTMLPVLGSVPLVAAPSNGHNGHRLIGRLSSARAVLLREIRPALPPALERRLLKAGHILPATGADQADLPATPPASAEKPGPRPSRRRLASDRLAQEAIRNICASILLSRSVSPPRILMVTSAVPGEGKTTIASELGHALAESGASTLLVECDMRRPGLREVFSVGTEGGLSLFLSGHVNRSPAIHPTKNVNLFVVGAGPTAPNPPALLGSIKMASFLREMLSSFRFVILDTPPLLPMADARLLAPMTEGVVLVVRAGAVPKAVLRRALALLAPTGATILGAVLNGVDTRGPESPYYQYYQRYYES